MLKLNSQDLLDGGMIPEGLFPPPQSLQEDRLCRELYINSEQLWYLRGDITTLIPTKHEKLQRGQVRLFVKLIKANHLPEYVGGFNQELIDYFRAALRLQRPDEWDHVAQAMQEEKPFYYESCGSHISDFHIRYLTLFGAGVTA